VSQWQAEATAASGARMVFGLAADDEDQARELAHGKLPWEPARLVLVSLEPPCRPHRVRHPCKGRGKP
jgi:hypothetical protein